MAHGMLSNNSLQSPDHRDGCRNSKSADQQDNENEELDINKILKDIQYLGNTYFLRVASLRPIILFIHIT